MIQALGARLLDKEGQELTRGCGALDKLAQIDLTHFDQGIFAPEFLVASDVNNPLTGPTGASHVFGPQKGATEEMVAQLDKNLPHYAASNKKEVGIDVEMMPGAGAAGG
ncbi:glycerate kinase, partial [Enterococcus faecalis]|uniref:glycerate kinase n=1 Tax=Enterococcus faecalis TaxID=1351 RepID=UPI003D6AD259